MSSVETAVEGLVRAIKESAIYEEYLQQLASVKQVPGLKEQIDDFRQRNFILQNSSDCAFEQVCEFERQYEEFRENPVVSGFLEAELAYCRMIQEINTYIDQNVYFE